MDTSKDLFVATCMHTKRKEKRVLYLEQLNGSRVIMTVDLVAWMVNVFSSRGWFVGSMRLQIWSLSGWLVMKVVQFDYLGGW